MPNRRSFLTSAASALAVPGVASATALRSATSQSPKSATNEKFKLAFAPHPGMFSNHASGGVLDEIRYAADQGFTAWEQNGMPNVPTDMQEKIGDLLREKGMQMGVFVGYADFQRPTFAVKQDEYQAQVVTAIRDSVEVAKRCGAKFFTVVPGTVDGQLKDDWKPWGGARLADGFQTGNAIELLRRCAEILEPHDLVMVLEPLNWRTDHGGVFLERSDQAYALCKAVDSPACKILFDIYHQQITEGNLMPNINRCWNEIAYFQIGDNPGRKEPGTGEINYQFLMQQIDQRARREGREFIFGMEHGNSQPGTEGEQLVISAYRAIDPAK